MPRYPYDQKTDQIILPPELEKEIRVLVRGGNKIQAMRQVMDLTGAGLKVSKDYVDQFDTPRPTPWLK
jgi:ribosomal protein L7/L12